jgi:hypothetical protein
MTTSSIEKLRAALSTHQQNEINDIVQSAHVLYKAMLKKALSACQQSEICLISEHIYNLLPRDLCKLIGCYAESGWCHELLNQPFEMLSNCLACNQAKLKEQWCFEFCNRAFTVCPQLHIEFRIHGPLWIEAYRMTQEVWDNIRASLTPLFFLPTYVDSKIKRLR